ncbi:hypothetical protein ACOSQ3_014200 [Xanthoceras sorbifolium]
MTHFLVSNNLRSQALDLLHLVVFKKRNDFSSFVFASLIETRGTHLPGINFDFIFDALMIVYIDLWFVNDAIQCFRLVRKHNFRIPVMDVLQRKENQGCPDDVNVFNENKEKEKKNKRDRRARFMVDPLWIVNLSSRWIRETPSHGYWMDPY